MRHAPRVWSSVLAALLLAACGKKGPPVPPAPRGPLAPERVEARQNGDRFVVSFVVPPVRKAGHPSAIDRAELIRVSYAPGGGPPVDPDAFRRRGVVVAVLGDGPFVAGATRRFVDRPSSDDRVATPGSTFRYAARLVDPRGRVSPLGLAPDLVPIEVVPGPTGLRGEPTADGVRLTWDTAPGLTYNLYRSPIGEDVPLRPVHDRPLSVGEYLDAEAPTGGRYSYTVRVVRGDPPPYLEGLDGGPLEIVAEDRFAPAPPRGLVAVQEGPAVRLFWDPNAERDVAGYRVYRFSGGAEGWTPVGPDLHVRPLYRDDAVEAGRVVGYRVTAIDRATPPNESEPSAAVEISIAAEPAAAEERDP